MHEKMNLSQPIFFREVKMGMVILHWKRMLSTRISVNMCSVLWKKKCKSEWLMKSEQAPSLWTTSAVGYLS